MYVGTEFMPELDEGALLIQTVLPGEASDEAAPTDPCESPFSYRLSKKKAARLGAPCGPRQGRAATGTLPCVVAHMMTACCSASGPLAAGSLVRDAD
jgi:hypothetical protein